MSYRLAADAVILIHLLFILFASAGALLALRWPWIAFIQIPAAVWGAFIEISGKVCPLTHLETYFLIKAGESGYPEDFIEHYLMPCIYPAGLTREFQYLLALLVVSANLFIYGLMIYRQKAGKKNP